MIIIKNFKTSNRVIELASYTIIKKSTVRNTASVFGLSKSTVYNDLTDKLPRINKELASNVNEILKENKEERHIRGGEATKRKYLSLKKQ